MQVLRLLLLQLLEVELQLLGRHWQLLLLLLLLLGGLLLQMGGKLWLLMLLLLLLLRLLGLWLLLLQVQFGSGGPAVETLHCLHCHCKEGLHLKKFGPVVSSEDAQVVGFLGGGLEGAEDAPADVGGSRRGELLLLNSLGRGGLGRLGVSEFLEVGEVLDVAFGSVGDSCGDSGVGGFEGLGGLFAGLVALLDAVGSGGVGLSGGLGAGQFRRFGCPRRPEPRELVRKVGVVWVILDGTLSGLDARIELVECRADGGLVGSRSGR